MSLSNTTVSWNPSTPAVLHDINLDIKSGELIAIVGPVGCGKSSLLSAILGEMNLISGTINTKNVRKMELFVIINKALLGLLCIGTLYKIRVI